MRLQPLGHRVLIRPDEQPTESVGGILLPDRHDHVSMSGTVVAVGSGPRREALVREAIVKRCLRAIDGMVAAYGPHLLLQGVKQALNSYAKWQDVAPQITVGDRVAFSAESGLTFNEDGTQYLIMNEDDVVVLVDEVEQAS